MSCRFTHEDAAYVLGSLAPAERLTFEKHLTECETCTRAVLELAGIPGLLSRTGAKVLASSSVQQQPVPDTVLPALFRAVRRGRRRRTLAAAGAAATMAAVVAPLVTSQLDLGGGVASTLPGAGSAPSELTPQPMDPVGDVPLQANLLLETVTWGTRLDLICTYDTTSVRYALPPAVNYTLVVRTRDGRTERVGSWRSVNGRTIRLTAGTAANRQEIASVEVRTPDGRVVLTAAA